MPVKRPMEHTAATLQELGRRMRACAAELEKAAADMQATNIETMVVDHSLSGLRGLADVEQFARSCAAAYYAAREESGAYGKIQFTKIDISERISYEKNQGKGSGKKRS